MVDTVASATTDEVEDEVLTYMAGWVVREVKKCEEVEGCTDCEQLLVSIPADDHNYCRRPQDSSTFLKKKKYSPSANLIEPSDQIKRIIINLEKVIKPLIMSYWSSPGIYRKINDSVSIMDIFQSLDISQHNPNHLKLIKSTIMHKFIICRLHAQSKFLNRSIAEDGQRTRRKAKSFKGH